MYFKEIYKLTDDYFFIIVISFFYQWKILLKVKTFVFQKSYMRCKKNVGDKIVHLKIIYKFYFKQFLYKTRSFRFKTIYKFAFDCFFIGLITFLLFIRNLSIKMKNSICPPKYTRYRKNAKKQNCLFQKHLQYWCWSFFHRIYNFCLLMKNIISKCKCGSTGYEIKIERKVRVLLWECFP